MSKLIETFIRPRKKNSIEVIHVGAAGEVSVPVRLYDGDRVTFSGTGGELWSARLDGDVLTWTSLAMPVTVNAEFLRRWADHQEGWPAKIEAERVADEAAEAEG